MLEFGHILIISKNHMYGRYYLQSERGIAKRREAKDMTQSLLIALTSPNRGTRLWSQRSSNADVPTMSYTDYSFP